MADAPWLVAGVVLLVAGVTSLIVAKGLVVLLTRHGVLDVPNDRSSHRVPTPRGGGIAILTPFLVMFAMAGAVFGTPAPWLLLVAVGGLGVLGLADDSRKGLPVGLRLGCQTALGVVVLAGSGGGLARLPLPPPLDLVTGPVGPIVSLVWFVAVVNIFNFMDGIDGLAGTQGLIGCLGLAFLGWGTWLGPVALALGGGCVGFLLLNWQPARIFMGDVGSLALGGFFAAAPLLLPGERQGSTVFFAAVFLWFFLFDGTFTLLRRLVRGEKIWQAHRSHLYQRLVRTGLGHAHVAALYGTLGAVLAGVAVWSGETPGARWLVLLLAGTLGSAVVVLVAIREAGRVEGRTG